MDESNSRSKVLQFFTAHPLLGLIGCLGSFASIIALPFGVFPWLAAPKRELSFCINPVRIPIVQIARRSDVSVLYKGKATTGDVTAMQIAVWNAGRESIKSDDVLRPIILRMETNQIMESSILKFTRDVSEFQIDTNRISSNAFGMKWRILEKNDGALFQIVYSGNPEAPLTVDGIIQGQAYPYKITVEQHSHLLTLLIYVNIGSSAALACLTIAIKKVRRLRWTSVLPSLGACIAMLLYVLFWMKRSFTPFGF